MDSHRKFLILYSFAGESGFDPDRHQCQAWRHSQMLSEMSRISREPHAHVQRHAALAECASQHRAALDSPNARRNQEWHRGCRMGAVSN